MTRSLFGGSFCRRASNFGDSVAPTKEARRHRGARAKIIYKFGAKFSGLRTDAVARQNENSDLQVAGRKRPGRDVNEVGPAPKRVDSGSHLLRKGRRKERRKDPR